MTRSTTDQVQAVQPVFARKHCWIILIRLASGCRVCIVSFTEYKIDGSILVIDHVVLDVTVFSILDFGLFIAQVGVLVVLLHGHRLAATVFIGIHIVIRAIPKLD
jgi:hypothetical protein